MKLVSTYPRLIALSALTALGVCLVSAQSYYDDDIYYDPSKVKKEKPVQQKKKTPTSQQPVNSSGSTQLYYDGAQYVPWENVGEYQSADSYQPTGSSTRDVDEYNRRYSSAPANNSNQTDSITLQQFVEMSNTQKLARFQDSEVAAQAAASNGGGMYYDNLGNPIYADNVTHTSSQPSTTINLNVVGGYPYYGYYGYGSPWYWNSWGYDPWWGGYYSPYWGPSWSWSWGWGPSWSWGPSWGWYDPYWGPSYWTYYRPQSSPGAYRPHTTGGRNSGAIGSGRYTSGNGTSYRYTGGGRNSGATRPTTQSASTSRPGYRVPLGTPSNTGSNAAGYGQRGRSSSGSYSTPANNNRGSYNTPSNDSYRNHNNSGSYRNQSGNFGGSRGGFSSGGSHGGHHGAAGGGGGRRGR